MKISTKKKDNSMKKIIGIIACTLVAGYCFAQQKRPLDIKACTSWNRIDNPNISPTGRYATYKIVPTETSYSESGKIPVMLFDSKTKKYINLGNVDGINYFNYDRQLFYSETDTADNEFTYIIDLPSGKKRRWTHPEALEPIGITNFTASRIQIPENKEKNIKSHSNLIIRNLTKNDSVCIEDIKYHSIYNNDRNLIFVQEKGDKRAIKYGPLMGPYKTLVERDKASIPSSFSFDSSTLTGQFDINESVYCSFDLNKRTVDTIFNIKEIPVPAGKQIARLNLMKDRNYVMVQLSDANRAATATKEEKKKDESFELELWTWNEMEVPTLQSEHGQMRNPVDKYIYDRKAKKLVKAIPAGCEESVPYRDMTCTNYMIYTDKNPYQYQREWRDKVPFDMYAVNIHTGESRMIGKEYRELPKWSPDGRWAMIYDSLNKNWNKFDAQTGEFVNASAEIPYPVYDELWDKPAPAPAYGIGGWTEDSKYVFIMDGFDWWKIALDGKEKTSCLTKGVSRKNQIAYRKLFSNIDKEIFEPNEKIYVLGVHHKDMSQSICLLDMKGNVKSLIHGQYAFQVKAFSDNKKYCVWTRQNVQTYPDLWISTAEFTNAQKFTDANPQQKEYLWGTCKLVEWTNYEGKKNRGLLYLPENYDSTKEYPVLVQFYETHTEETNNYYFPTLSSAMANVIYTVSNGYIVFMPDVHFTIGTPGKSTYDAVISGTNWLIDQGYAHKGKIGLQGHSWSGFQTSYLVTKTDLFTCVQIGSPITDMVTGYLGIRNGSGLPRYFMYEETQRRMREMLWDAKDKYLAMCPIIDADKITTPLLIFHNDHDEAVAYEQGRALYLAMRRLQKPAWMCNYKGQGHFVLKTPQQRDWTIRQTQFFDYYLKGAKMPRWMKEGIHLKERGYDQKYDLVK